MLTNKNKFLLVSSILGTLYALYIIIYFSTLPEADDAFERLATNIATAMVTPHIILIVIATIFSWLGFSLKKTGFSLTAAILYSVGAVMFPIYALMVSPMIVLGFIGYAKQKELNKTIY